MATTIFTVHNSRESFSIRNQLLLILLFAACPHVVLCSNAARDSYPMWMRRLLRGRERVIQNGVDIDRIIRSLPDPLLKRDRVGGVHVVSVGRLIPRKDPATLLRAFALSSGDEDRLTYIGAGNEAPRLLETAQRNGIRSRLSLVGAVPRDEVYHRIAQADLFVSTSRAEGLPVAVLEAMACALPVVISDIPPHREIAGTGDLIRLVKPGDVAAFARELERYRMMPAAERRRIGRRCRDTVARHFGLDLMHNGYQELYERVAGQAEMMDGNPTPR